MACVMVDDNTDDNDNTDNTDKHCDVNDNTGQLFVLFNQDFSKPKFF